MARPIYLIGFMGAGKTEVGKRMAEICGYDVFDMDEQIVREEGKEITDIFREDGEAYFRHKESEVLRKIAKQDCIITTGGGVILNEENRRFLKGEQTVFLACDPAITAVRLEHDTTRPLIQKKSQADIAEMYEARLPLYKECAEMIIDTTSASIDEVANQIIERMNIATSGYTS
ncbi:shikimate kinase [Bacillus sp. FJAT-50079]|uniref:shikimate kinase n=1 Tax=Bacillus sp. FJAT-50079 TaxID=2833577 RepID=UPI001BC94D38|nr:shikimate kinase [Bacillus sp. FJAT-50079]MBS4209614.1 shikimate kinase [Bacillus sp. FJAT-50079]